MSRMVDIETERLILRKAKLKDSKELFLNCFSQKGVNKYLSWELHKTEEETKQFIFKIIERYMKEHEFAWVIEVKATGRVIGLIEVVNQSKYHKWAELGFEIGSEFWGLGFTTEAIKAVIKYMFFLNYERVQGMCHENNIASEKAMLKSGMKFEGLLSRYGYNKRTGEVYNLKMFAALNKEGLCKRRLRNLIKKDQLTQEECLSMED